MSDTLGRISVPSPVSSGLTFPLTSDFGYGTSRPIQTVSHRFGELAEKSYQTFLIGFGPRKFQFRKSVISYQNRAALFSFFESVQGSTQSFSYAVPQADKSTITYPVIFDTQPLSVSELASACQSGITFIECPSATPSYSVSSTCLRFPSSTLQTALLSQVQQIIPLVHIKVRESAVPDIYLSDRRCTVGGQLYLPRLLNLGEAGTDVIMSQNISGAADNVQFTFANADRVMTALCNDTDLKYASIDLSLYHVNSQILLQLWKGFIISFVSDGSPQFTTQCSDGLYQVTQQYPSRTVNRTCWKTFNDGVACPYNMHGSGGDPTPTTGCSYYFTTPYAPGDPNNTGGCTEHGMTPFFGGHQADPQGVNIKDNSTGVAGFGRNVVTATSIVSDTVYGQALPDIWCNQGTSALNAFYANALMIDVRDEGDFIDGLGILGSGPLGAYTISGNSSGVIVTNADGYTFLVAPLMDGFPPQGLKFSSSSSLSFKTNTALGLRQVLGNDPGTPTTDSFSLGQGTPQVWGPEMAAGTSFVELRYAKPSGIAPSTPDQHNMVIPIAQGLTGFTWDAGGNRTAVPGLINPFWIAVNTVIRALGLNLADSGTQQNLFVLSSLYKGDGTGTVEIADTMVPAILGTGNELQFQFQGTIAQQKPLRDWLTEIIACALGYFTFEFGKLKLGCRINASATDAFTVGNMLFQSLRLEPIQASFEHLVVNFADVAYLYQANTADYQDKSHALFSYARGGAPLTANQHVVGCSTLSQALRIAATRTREEIGGVNSTEWKNARNASFQTTILSLNTEVGQVISITHPDVPTGTANFRIQRWVLKKDWSIEIQAKTVTPSMYDLTIGPKPADVKPAPLPILFYPQPVGPQWGPYTIQAPATDALFPNEWTFDVSQSYLPTGGTDPSAVVTVTGEMPINEFIPGCGAPTITDGQITQSTTGGSIPGGEYLRVSICATQGLSYSPPSVIAIVKIPTGTNTNQFTISGIQWPKIAGLQAYQVFCSDVDDLICSQGSGALTAGGDGTIYAPTSITVTGPLFRSTWGLPDPHLVKVRAKAKPLIHGGVEGGRVDSLDTSHIVASLCIDGASTDNWAGRAIAIIGRQGSATPASAPYVTFNVTAFDPTLGKFTLSSDPVAAGVLVGDALVVCTLGVDNSADRYTVTDSGLANAQDLPTPHAGLVPSDQTLKGTVFRVIKGTSRGQTAKLVDNGATSVKLDAPIVIDSTSVWIIEGPAWVYSSDSSDVDNAQAHLATSIPMSVDNSLSGSLLVSAVTVDDSGNESADGDGPVRMLFVWGAGLEEVTTG